METFQVENKQPAMKSSNNRILYILMITNLILGIVAVGLIAYVVLNVSGQDETKIIEDSESELELLSRFFLSPEELEELRNLTWEWTPVNRTIEFQGNDSSTLDFKIDTDWIPLGPGEVVHACCQSKQNFYTPIDGMITDINGTSRQLATYRNKSQFFPSEECVSTNGCTVCSCEHQVAVYDAVYVKSEGGYGITKFKYQDGCCKCVIRRSNYP